MIHHLLKLLWKQRRQNAWIVAELFLVFILLWYIMDYFTTIGYANSVDSAYDIKDTYQVRLTTVPQSSPNYIQYKHTERREGNISLSPSIPIYYRTYPAISTGRRGLPDTK